MAPADSADSAASPRLSVVVPLFNEEDNVEPLVEETSDDECAEPAGAAGDEDHDGPLTPSWPSLKVSTSPLPSRTGSR